MKNLEEKAKKYICPRGHGILAKSSDFVMAPRGVKSKFGLLRYGLYLKCRECDVEYLDREYSNRC